MPRLINWIVFATLCCASFGCSKSEAPKETKPADPKESFQVVLEAVKKRMENEHPDVLTYNDPEETKVYNFQTSDWAKKQLPARWYRRRVTFNFNGYDIKATDSIVTPYTATISYFVTLERAHPTGMPNEQYFTDKQLAVSDRVEWEGDRLGGQPINTATFGYTEGTWVSKRTKWPFIEEKYSQLESNEVLIRQ